MIFFKDFILDAKRDFTPAQRFIDSECIRLMDPYTPFAKKNGGTLKSAPNIQSGGGKIVQQTPYAKRWYYEKANFHEAPRRGNKWFARMAENHKKDILAGAAKILGVKNEKN